MPQVVWINHTHMIAYKWTISTKNQTRAAWEHVRAQNHAVHECNMLCQFGAACCIITPGHIKCPSDLDHTLDLRSDLVILFLLLSLLQPLDEWFNVLQEHIPSLRVATLLVPLHDGVLINDVCLIQETDNVTEDLQQPVVLIALDLRMNPG